MNPDLDRHEALERCTRLIDAEPRNAEAYRQRAIARLALHDRPRAVADYDIALRLDSKNLQYRRERASENYRQRQYAICIEDCNSILEHAPTDAAMLELRGRCHAAFGSSAAALADFDAAGASALKAALLRELGEAEPV